MDHDNIDNEKPLKNSFNLFVIPNLVLNLFQYRFGISSQEVVKQVQDDINGHVPLDFSEVSINEYRQNSYSPFSFSPTRGK